MSSVEKAVKPLTGYHVLAMFVAGFSVIIAVNLSLAYNAVKTFPGLEVANSYVASQSFDDRRDAQNALGWVVDVAGTPDLVRLKFAYADGKPVPLAKLTGRIGRPTTNAQDVTPDFIAVDGGHDAAVSLGAGRWTLWLDARDIDGNEFSRRYSLHIND